MKEDKQWARYAQNGYEVSSAGDRRFSAFHARLRDGRTIEEAYQLDAKGYRQLGYSLMEAKYDKGEHAPIKMTKEQLWEAYLNLWRQWAEENPDLISVLKIKSSGKVLTDQFAASPVNQARALAAILSEKS
jgi:hypothetical protein